RTLTGLTAAVQLRLRVAIGLQALQRCSGLLNRRARGSTVATHHFMPAWLSSDSSSFVNCRANPPLGSASLPVGPISCSRSSNYQSGRLRTARLQVRFLPGVPFCRVSPTTRGAPLRTERLGVEIPHAAPIWPTILLEQYRTDGMDGACAFCNREVPTRGHHVGAADRPRSGSAIPSPPGLFGRRPSDFRAAN